MHKVRKSKARPGRRGSVSIFEILRDLTDKLASRLLDVKGHWSTHVLATLPLLTVSALSLGLANWVQPISYLSAAGTILTLLVLIIPIITLIVSMLAYLIRTIFTSADEQHNRIWELARRKYPDDFTRLIELALSERDLNVSEPKTAIELMADQCCQTPVLASSFVERITLPPLIFGYVLLIFSAASVSLSCWDYLGGHNRSDFGTLMYVSPGLVAALRLCEHSVYLNLVTLATLGFGDGAPLTLASRLMVDLEIVTTIFVITFVANLIGGLVMENSGLAWHGRRGSLIEFIEKELENELGRRVKV